MKKHFFIFFKGLTLKQIKTTFLEGGSPTLTSNRKAETENVLKLYEPKVMLPYL